MKTWDIFCRVVDNYGDIGVCWRLARQLATEYNLEVRLWVDDIGALKQIWPDTALTQNQTLAGVNVCTWHEGFVTDIIADVVIEAFACNIPDKYVDSMRRAARAPYWLNLEYLSAESWVEGCHRLNSIHPQNGLKKTFFFPGFSQRTGGLLREQDLLIKRDNFIAADEKHAFLRHLGITQPHDNTLIVSLFSYENAAIASLLNTWMQASNPVLCLVPAGKTLISINHTLRQQLAIGDTYTHAQLTLKIIPFLPQLDYDHLLWTCDINFVRGEDSFVRAQWAAKPFIWHIYPQEEDAHLIKLKAFLDKYTQTMSPKLACAIKSLWFSWNTGEDCTDTWQQILMQHRAWQESSQDWTRSLNTEPDLAHNLVHFCQ